VLGRAGRGYATPPRLRRFELLRVIPRHLEPCRRHPLLPALEGVVHERDEDAGGFLVSMAQYSHLDEGINASGAVGPRLSWFHGPHRLAAVPRLPALPCPPATRLAAGPSRTERHAVP